MFSGRLTRGQVRDFSMGTQAAADHEQKLQTPKVGAVQRVHPSGGGKMDLTERELGYGRVGGDKAGTVLTLF